MIVMKFGGTSVGRADTFAVALARVRDVALSLQPVVVVSAHAGVTNTLATYCEEPSHRREISDLVMDQHLSFAVDVGVPPDALQRTLTAWRAWVERTLDTAGPLSPEQRDVTLGFGERLSADLFAAALRNAGVPAKAKLAGEIGLVTDDHFGDAHPLDDCEERLRVSLLQAKGVQVVTGFTGLTTDGRVTTLGRGGSDYTASLIGSAIGASEVQIWTDMSGLLSADAAVVEAAHPLPLLSFREASELAYFGARVPHPKTLLPALERGISVRVLNTSRPFEPGTFITPDAGPSAEGWGVKSIAFKRGITAVTIQSSRMLLAHGFLARVFEVFGQHRVIVDLVTTSEVSISITVDDASRLPAALADLEGIGNVDVKHQLAVVAVVGEDAPHRVGLAGRVFDLLGDAGIVVQMISQGASRVNLSFVVAETDVERAVCVLHDGLVLAGVATAQV